MNKLPVLGIGLNATGVPVRPAVTNTHHEVGREHGGVAIAMGRLEPHHAGHQWMVIRNRPPAHQGRNNGNTRKLCKLNQKVARITVDNAATGNQQGLVGLVQQVQCFLDLRP